MTQSKRIFSSPLVALSVACAGSPTDSPGRPVSIIVAEQVVAGSLGSAQLVNQSGAEIEIGAISCGVRTDQLVDTRWTEVPRASSICPQPGFTLADGAAYPFVFQAPATPGSFRLRAFSQGDTVFSNVFTVR